MARRLLAAALLTALGVGGLAACSPDTSSTPAGELVTAWSQADAEWVAEMPTRTLMTTDAERDAWLSDVPADAPDRDAVLAVDLGTHVLFAGSYPSCTEHSAVLVEQTDQGYGVRFVVVDPESDTLCAWSPIALDVWAIPHSETGGAAPVLVGLGS